MRWSCTTEGQEGSLCPESPSTSITALEKRFLGGFFGNNGGTHWRRAYLNGSQTHSLRAFVAPSWLQAASCCVVHTGRSALNVSHRGVSCALVQRCAAVTSVLFMRLIPFTWRDAEVNEKSCISDGGKMRPLLNPCISSLTFFQLLAVLKDVSLCPKHVSTKMQKSTSYASTIFYYSLSLSLSLSLCLSIVLSWEGTRNGE